MTTNDTRTGKQFGIQAAPFTEAIHIGELTKDRTRFKGDFQDASNQAIAAVAQFVDKHYDGAVLFTYEGGLKVSIKVGDQADEPPRDAEPTTVTAEQITAEIHKVTSTWDEPLDEVHDIPQITNALLARFRIEGDEA